MNARDLAVFLVATAVVMGVVALVLQEIRHTRRDKAREALQRAAEYRPARLSSVGRCADELPGYGSNVATSCDLAAGHSGWHQNDAGTRWSPGTLAQDEALETAAQLLHAQRHRAGTASTCGRCRADVQTIAPAFGWPA